MRILITAMGSRGDVQPVLALGRALRDAGHSVVVCAPPDFAAWAAELALEFVSAGDSVENWLRENSQFVSGNPLRVMRGMKTVLLEQAPRWFEATAGMAKGADAIVNASQVAGPSIAEAFRIPCFCVAYAPLLLRSSHHPPIVVPWQRLPRALNALAWSGVEWAYGSLMKEPINRERAKLGLAPIESVPRHLFEGLPYFLACDPVVAPPAPDWTRFDVMPTGPWYYDDPAPLDAEVEAFLAAGPPPLYVGFGSMVTGDPARVTRAVLEGAAGHRILLSKGWAGIGEGSLPANVKVVHGPMPHAKLFPRVAAVVHHGGSGTTAAALRAGVPQVIVPHLMDQFYFAHRLQILGIAPVGVPVERLTASRLGAAISKTLTLPPGPRTEAAARLREGEGLRRAVERVTHG